jgi:uncharacterized protein
MEAKLFTDRLRQDLKAAMRERLGGEVSLLRALIAAVDNAQAVELRPDHRPSDQHSFGSGTNEAPRRMLDNQDIIALLAKEITSREKATISYRSGGREDAAVVLENEITLLRRYL